ncbi:MAG: molybdenum cofactor guanylyltransferase [Alphaproteobacteria bacterium]|nr:molybdenum cofactor guanylyltransferase [Alphaproteobacteria bacterium]
MSGRGTGVAGVILAGGASARMGGIDKSLIMFGGRPLVSHAIALLRRQVDELALSVHAPDVRHVPFGLPLLADATKPDEGHQGPMAGIQAALDWAARPGGAAWCVTIPVDCPFLPKDLTARLREAADTAGAPGAYLTTPSGDEPLAAVWSVACAARAQQFLTAGGRSVRAFHREIGSAALAGEAAWCTNLNSPGDLAAAETAASARPRDRPPR